MVLPTLEHTYARAMPFCATKKLTSQNLRNEPWSRVGTFHVILQSKHKLMTASTVRVTNLTPGSDNPTLDPDTKVYHGLGEEADGNPDEALFDELVDNVRDDGVTAVVLFAAARG
jgi:hypothetical protein